MRTLFYNCIIALLVAGTIIVITGCGDSTPKRTLLVAIDYSGSVSAKERKSYTNKFEELIDRQNGKSEVILYVFAKSPTWMATKRPLDYTDMWNVDDNVIAKKAAEGKGTFLAPTLDRFAFDVKNSKYDPVIAAMLTDGDCADPKETTESAKKLAALSNFRCLLVGPIDTDNKAVDRLKTEAILAPLRDAGKLVICNKFDLEEGYQTLMKGAE